MDRTNLFTLFEELADSRNVEVNIDYSPLNHKIGKRNRKAITLRQKIILKSAFFIMAMFFFAAAYVQHNDPDPFLWMPAYLVPMFINVILIFKTLNLPTNGDLEYSEKCSSLPAKRHWWTFSFLSALVRWKVLNRVITTHIFYCFALGAWTLAHFIYRLAMTAVDVDFAVSKWVSEENMYAEEAKELLGLCLVIAWLSFVNNGNFLRFGKKGILIGTLLTGIPILAWVVIEKLAGDTCVCT